MSVENVDASSAQEEEMHEDAVGSLEIHTIPEKFLTEKKATPMSWTKRRITQGIVIIIVVGALMGIAAWLFVRSLAPQSLPQEEGFAPAQDTSQPASSAPTSPFSPQAPSLPTPAVPSPEEPPSVPTTTPLSAPTTTSSETPSPSLSEEISPPQTPVRILPTSTDSDSDGLTDVEEGIWGTHAQKPDTDADGYLDGLELAALFDPALAGGATLAQSSRIQTYVSPVFNYRILAPASWEMRVLDPETATQVLFTASTGEFVNVIAQQNLQGFSSARAWYLDQNTLAGAHTLTEVSTPTLSGVMSPDGLAAYFIEEGHLYTISYNPGLRDAVNFISTFKMMVQGFQVFERP